MQPPDHLHRKAAFTIEYLRNAVKRANELDVGDAKLIVHLNDQSVFVAAVIEHDSIVTHKNCVSISAFGYLRIAPLRCLRFSEPRL